MTESKVSSGFFISLEGIDGCGKSTQIVRLKKSLEEKGLAVITIREPGGCVLSEKIRGLLLDSDNGDVSATTELLLFNSARAQLIHEIVAPALKEGKIVLADRFGWATYAYQGYGRGLSLEHINSLRNIACGDIWPGFSFLLDISIPLMKERLSNTAKPDRMEQAGDAFFHKVREGYLKIAQENSKQFAVLDGSQSADSIHQQICEKVFAFIGKNGV